MKRRKSPEKQAAKQQIEIEAAQATQEVVAKVLTEERSLPQVNSLLIQLLESADRLLFQLEQANPSRSSLDCCAGCSFCCHIKVNVTPLELFFLYSHITDKLSSDELRAFETRAKRTDDRTRGMNDLERGKAQIPCPLLVNNRCIAYDARPLECRGYNSMDVNACRSAFENYDQWGVPMYLSQYSLFKHIQAGLMESEQITGRACELLELNAALRIAVTEPDAIDRWLNGEDSFADAALEYNDPEVRSFHPWTPSDDFYIK